MNTGIGSTTCRWLLALLLVGPASVNGANALQVYKAKPLPPFELADLDGETHALEDYEGRVLLINFWASWCAPCVRELPSLARLEQQLSKEPFALLAINLAEEADVLKAFLAQHPLAVTVLSDADGTVAREWGLFAYPTSFLLDVAGDIRQVAYGELQWDLPETVAVIKSLLMESETEPESTPKPGGEANQ